MKDWQRYEVYEVISKKNPPPPSIHLGYIIPFELEKLISKIFGEKRNTYTLIGKYIYFPQ